MSRKSTPEPAPESAPDMVRARTAPDGTEAPAVVAPAAAPGFALPTGGGAYVLRDGAPVPEDAPAPLNDTL